MAEHGASAAGTEAFFKWTDAETRALITWRRDHEALFTGRRNAAKTGWEQFISDRGLMGQVTSGQAKKKWENLKKKYKELKSPPTGVSTEGGETTAASWQWFTIMDEAIGGRPSISPPVLVASACGEGDAVVVSSQNRRQDRPGSGRKRKNSDLLEFLQRQAEVEEERERQALERERQREAEALEREERREAREREERREFLGQFISLFERFINK